MKDSKTTISQLKERLAKFKDDRDWQQFYNPKDLAEAITLESAELLEIFRWLTPKESKELLNDPKFKKRIESEMADVFIFLLNFANAAGIDLAKVTFEKIEENEKKYPAEKARGNAKKYDEL
jgi:NTP pyrophosphatase (non-canonical NTP hydrolase)